MNIVDRFKVPDEVRKERLDMCLKCEHFLKLTRQCKKCGCFMDLKTWVRDLECPVGKWSKYGSGNSWDTDVDQENNNTWGSY